MALAEAGADYCRAHNGIREEDEDVCDFFDHYDSECDPTPLLYDNGERDQ